MILVLGLEAEVGGLLGRVDQVAAEVAQHQHVGLQRLDARQEGRVVGRADRVADVGQRLHAQRRAGALEAAHHLVAVRIVGGQVDHLLAEFRKRIAGDGAGGDVRIERLVEGVEAPVLGFVDRVRLADGVEQDLAFLADRVDRQLRGGRQRADDEVDLVLLDQLQRAGRRFARIELVVAHQQFGHAAVEAAALVEFLDRQFGGALLVLRFRGKRAGQRRRETYLDRRAVLRPGDVEPQRRAGGGDAGADQLAAAFVWGGLGHACLLIACDER